MKNSGGHKFLIDGFPRNKENLDSWVNLMHDSCDVPFVLYLKCPEVDCS